MFSKFVEDENVVCAQIYKSHLHDMQIFSFKGIN